MNKLRTIVIAIGVALVFILIAALAIIIARGGVITGTGEILETGIIRISAKPDDVVVYIDGVERSLQDKQISGLEDKEYQIKVTKEGYSSWEKTIKAEPGIVIEIFAQLFPTSLNLTEITKTNIDRAFYSPDGQYVIYVVKSSEIGANLGLWKLKLTDPTITILQNRPLKISNITPTLSSAISGNYSIDFAPDNRFIMIQNLDTNDYYILNAELYNEPSTSINTDLGFTPDKLNWFNNSSSLIISEGNTVFEYNLQDKTSALISITPDNIPVYTANKDRVVFYDHNNKRLATYQNRKSQELEVENIVLPEGIEEIYVSELEPTLIIFKTTKGFFYLNTQKSFINKIGEGLTFLEFSRDGKSALFTDGVKLMSYTVEEFIAEDRFEAKLNTVISDYKAEIHNAKITPDSQHIFILNSSNENKVIQVCDKDGGNFITLLDDSRVSGFNISTPVDSSSLFLLLNDEIRENGERHVLRTNLYELDLKEPRK